MSTSSRYAVNQPSNANFNAATTAGWIQLPRAGGGSIGWQVVMPVAVTGTIAFDVTDDDNPLVAQGVILGASPIVLAAPFLALSTPAAVAVNTNFEFSPGTANPCPTAQWMRMRWVFSAGGTATGLNVGVSVRQSH